MIKGTMGGMGPLGLPWLWWGIGAGLGWFLIAGKKKAASAK